MDENDHQQPQAKRPDEEAMDKGFIIDDFDIGYVEGGTGNTTVNVGVTVEKVQKKRKLRQKERKKKKTPFVICVPLAKVVYLLNRNKKKKKKKGKEGKKKGMGKKKGEEGKKKETGKKNERTKEDPREIAKLEMERLLKLRDEQQQKLLYMMNCFNVPKNNKVTITRTADISCMQKFRDWKGITLVPVLGLSTDQTLE
ncbi:hypothetical protein LguiA_009764 [Lonicera macranthoides]